MSIFIRCNSFPRGADSPVFPGNPEGSAVLMWQHAKIYSGSKDCLSPLRTSSFNICNDQVSSQTLPQTPECTELLRFSPISLVLHIICVVPV